MQQDFLFSCISRDVRPQGEVLDAYEKHTRDRGASAHMLLRETLTCMLTCSHFEYSWLILYIERTIRYPHRRISGRWLGR